MFVHPRHASISTAASLARHSIQTTCHADIDASLKELRAVSRRLIAFSLPYTHELQILERIYYKGKNQHRSALFWQKVVEIRRLGARVSDLDMQSLVEDLRGMFYASDGRSNSKAFRSAWSHTPDAKTCEIILKRLRSTCLLVDKARDRFRLAHRSFTQQLQTATFLPLTMTLIAITGRLDFLLLELRSVIAMKWHAVMRVGKAINLDSNFQFPAAIVDPTLSPADESNSSTPSERPRKRQKRSAVVQGTEDLGSKIIRAHDPHLAIVNILSTPSKAEPVPSGFDPSVALSDQQTEKLASQSSLVQFTQPPTAHDSQHDVDDSATSRAFKEPFATLSLSTPVNETSSRRAPAPISQSQEVDSIGKQKRKIKKKAKKKRDEIDDIFGI